MADNYLNKTGLQRFFNNIKNLFVPVTRKVNNKALSSDISLTPSDIGAVAKTGDTMTGNLRIEKAVPYITQKSTNINSQIGKTVPSSHTSLGGYDLYDSEGYRPFFSDVIKSTSDDLYKSFILRRKNASGTDILNGFYLHINASGNPTVSFSNETVRAAWRNGLNLPFGSDVSSVGHYYTASGYPYIRYTDTSNNQHQIVLANNGLFYQTLASGASSWSNVWSLRNTAMGNPTIASGVGATVANNASGKIGDLVSINLRLSGAKLAAGTADICTLPSGFRPSEQAFVVLLINGVYRNGAIFDTGVVRVYGGVAVSGVEIKILSTFMI